MKITIGKQQLKKGLLLLYIKLNNNEIVDSEHKFGVILDYDINNKIVGIEIIFQWKRTK